MNLPFSESAVIERDKLIHYLLNLKHPFGRSKAHFFMRFGFSINRWEEFAEALRRHGRENPIADFRESGFGVRYLVDGPLFTPDGRQPEIRTVWQRGKNELAPRLITAYPLGES